LNTSYITVSAPTDSSHARAWSHNDKRLSMTTPRSRAASWIWIVDDKTGKLATSNQIKSEFLTWLKFLISEIDTWIITAICLEMIGGTSITCSAHSFWLCRSFRTARIDTLVSTRSTSRTCRVVSRRDVTSQVEFGLLY